MRFEVTRRPLRHNTEVVEVQLTEPTRKRVRILSQIAFYSSTAAALVYLFKPRTKPEEQIEAPSDQE